MRLFLLSCAAAFVWTSCQSEVASSSARPQSAQKLYVVKCAKCHELYDPKKYSEADWDLWMTKMKKNSKLKPEQFELMQDYTQSLRIQQSPPAQ